MCASSHGASSGFGKAVAQHVPKNGDVAVVTARKREVLSSLSSQYSGGRLCVLEVDVTKEQDVVSASAKTKERSLSKARRSVQ
jgi:NADP-dependent 3-hydroxy acid dehydrogenase YdfG